MVPFFILQSNLTPQIITQTFMLTRGLNLDLQKNHFLLLVFVKVGDVGKVLSCLEKEATHMEVVYINTVPGKVPPGRSYKLDCLAYKNLKEIIVKHH